MARRDRPGGGGHGRGRAEDVRRKGPVLRPAGRRAGRPAALRRKAGPHREKTQGGKTCKVFPPCLSVPKGGPSGPLGQGAQLLLQGLLAPEGVGAGPLQPGQEGVHLPGGGRDPRLGVLDAGLDHPVGEKVVEDIVEEGGQLFATMSSDEFKNGQKNNPPRLREGLNIKNLYFRVLFIFLCSDLVPHLT